MFKNYLLITMRYMKRDKIYTYINIVGLSIGMACCTLILAYIAYELSFDKFHSKADDIYRIAIQGKIGDSPINWAATTAAAGPLMVDEFPEVVDAVRICYPEHTVFSYGDKKFVEFAPLFVDKSFFKIFSFRLLRGNPETVLEAPFSLVITDEIARKYFGDEEPTGKILKLNNQDEYKITGVVEKPPANSHFTFDILASFETYSSTDPALVEGWVYWAFQTYLLLTPDADSKKLQAKFDGFIENHIGEMLRKIGAKHRWYLQPLTSIHLHSHLQMELAPNSDIRYIYALAAIAFFILLIAGINFMNLSTARYARRTKEVGIRKALGADRGKLIRQFLGESILMAILAVVISFILTAIVLSYFNGLFELDIKMKDFLTPWPIAGVVMMTIFVGFISGSYPALYLSHFGSVNIFKNRIMLTSKKTHFRSSLIVFQFAVSIALITGTIAVYEQLNFMKNKKLGFTKEHKIVLPLRDSETQTKLKTIKSELLTLDGVLGACGSHMVPGEYEYGLITCYPESLGHGMRMEVIEADEDFLDVYGIEIVAGRGFSEQMIRDQFDVALINETAVRKLGWKNPVGKRITDHINPGKPRVRRVIGVFKDIHHKTLLEPIEPTMLDYAPNTASKLTLLLNGDNISQTLAAIQKKWQTLAPQLPFEYFFLDQLIDDLYKKEEKLGRIIQLFTFLGIFIGCLGLLGLASFTAEQRTKEIGIRKVLGASVCRIIKMLNQDFVKWVLLANIIAWPAAWFAMNKWLENFAYRIELSWWMFALAGGLALLIALLTVSWQAVRAATANPVEALRYE